MCAHVQKAPELSIVCGRDLGWQDIKSAASGVVVGKLAGVCCWPLSAAAHLEWTYS